MLAVGSLISGSGAARTAIFCYAMALHAVIFFILARWAALPCYACCAVATCLLRHGAARCDLLHPCAVGSPASPPAMTVPCLLCCAYPPAFHAVISTSLRMPRLLVCPSHATPPVRSPVACHGVSSSRHNSPRTACPPPPLPQDFTPTHGAPRGAGGDLPAPAALAHSSGGGRRQRAARRRRAGGSGRGGSAGGGDSGAALAATVAFSRRSCTCCYVTQSLTRGREQPGEPAPQFGRFMLCSLLFTSSSLHCIQIQHCISDCQATF